MNAPLQGVPGRTAQGDEIYRQIRTEIHFELNLVNARVNWLIASQAFLFVPLTIGAQGRPLDESLFFPMIPVLGLAICLLVTVSVLAAFWRSQQWRAKARRGGYDGRGEHRSFSIIAPRSPAIPLLGAVGGLGVPLVLAGTWAWLLIWPPG